MTFGFLIKFSGTIMDLFIPMLLSFILDDVVPTKNKTMIFLYGGLMLLCSVVAILGNVSANRIAARVARDVAEKLRNDLFIRISYLSARQLDAFTVPSLESRLTSDTYNVHQMVGMIQRLGVRAPLLLLGGIAVAFTLEPTLTLVLVALLPFIGFCVFNVSRKGIPLYRRQQEATDGMTRIVRENAQGARVVKALNREAAEQTRFDRANLELNRCEQRAAMTMALTNPLMNLFLNVGLVAVIFVGAIRVNAGMTKTGTIVAFLSYFTIILNAMMSVTRIFVMSSRGVASANRIGEVLDAPFDMEANPSLEPTSVAADSTSVAAKLSAVATDSVATPKIEFDDVCFSYNGVKNDIDRVSFRLYPGETLGIIGLTGAGKTTLISLMMRQYDADGGSVKLDGRDVRSMEQEAVARKFGAAFQNDFLFADTIRANIDFGRGLTDEEILVATERAQASAFIEEKGLDYPLAIKGANLSGGQKQRLILSRALAGAPEILVLDDSSSALDYATDAKLRRAVRENYLGKTSCVIVAQRVSSIRRANRILVMEDGRITGSGTHEELMESCPLYREIAESQMGGALLE